MKRISLIVPCLNEEQALPIFYQTTCRILTEELAAYDAEFILVDDGSTDGTLRVMESLAAEDLRVKYLSF